MSLLEVTGLTRNFGGVTAVDRLNLVVAPGETVSVIGPNGAGKTTLFNLITGLDVHDAGAIQFEGRSIAGMRPEQLAARGLARTFQHGRVFANLSVLDNVLLGAHTRLRAVRPSVPALGPLAELALALLRPRAVRAEEQALRAQRAARFNTGAWRAIGAGTSVTRTVVHIARQLAHAQLGDAQFLGCAPAPPVVGLVDEQASFHTTSMHILEFLYHEN